jgi:hypothetical protein
MTTDTVTINHKFTREEARKWIKRALPGTKFRAHACMNIAIAEDDQHYYRAATRVTVQLSKADALNMASEYLSDKREQDGCRIPCTEYRYSYGRDGVADSVSYWIG